MSAFFSLQQLASGMKGSLDMQYLQSIDSCVVLLFSRMEVGIDRYSDIGEIQGSIMGFGLLLTGKNRNKNKTKHLFYKHERVLGNKGRILGPGRTN